MARITQVVLTGCKSYADSRRKFKQNVPVTMDPKQAEKYQGNSYFSVRTVDDGRAKQGVAAQKANPGDPFAAAVSDETVRVPSRKKKAARLKPKEGE